MEWLIAKAFAALLAPLDALGKPMHGMSLGAAHRVAERVDQRTQAVRSQNQLGLSLTVFLSVLTLAFAAIALRQVRQLREPCSVHRTVIRKSCCSTSAMSRASGTGFPSGAPPEASTGLSSARCRWAA